LSSSSDPIYSDRLQDECSECSSQLFRPQSDERLKQDFTFCAQGHVWLNRRTKTKKKTSSSNNSGSSSGDKGGGYLDDMGATSNGEFTKGEKNPDEGVLEDM
jgi:hypothetical protein